MLLAAHQPNYLPYGGFFEKAARADRFVLVDHVQFVKRGPFGWIHRNRIRTASPKGWDWLTVPVLTKGRYTQSIRETEIDGGLPWARKHWRAIEWNYRKARCFSDYGPELHDLYRKPWKWLRDLNAESIGLLLGWLGIRREICFTSEMNLQGRSTDLVINLCRGMEADAYLSGKHGRDYLDREAFARAGIRLEIQDFQPRPYPQCDEDSFVPELSVLDLILNCGPAGRRILLGGDDREA